MDTNDQDDRLNYYLSSLEELGEVLIGADKASKVSSEILRLTLGTIMASKGAIIVFDEIKKNFSFLATQGVEKKENLLDIDIVFRDLEKFKNKHIDINSKQNWIKKGFKQYLEEFKIKIIVPLFHNKHLLGLFFVGGKFMGQTFTTSDIKILKIISNHLTKALYNHKLLKEVETKKREINLKLLELETLFDISIAISSVLEVQELADDVLWRSVGILNASKGMLFIQNIDNPILEPKATFNWEEKNTLLSKNLKIFKDIEENKKGVILTKEKINPIQEKLKEKNLIITPLQAKGKILGYMVLCDKETRKGIEVFNDLDLDLLTALSNQAAVAIDNAALFKDITKAKNFNESILSSIATGVITINTLGEVDSINKAGLTIMKTNIENIIGNHYMYLLEKDPRLTELIMKAEHENKKTSILNTPFVTVSKETVVNMSVSQRVDPSGKTQGLVVAIEDITDISKVKNTFKRYVSKQVVDELLDDDTKLNLGGEKREVTVLFTDIRGFTSMSENMEPEKVVSTLNEYFSQMIDIVFKYNGTLDKIIGDELMVVYGAPTSSENDTERAIKTAIEMQQQIEKFNNKRKKENEIPIKVGIGINSGLVVSGNIGSRDMMDYTVIGDTVNLGARLCSAAGPDEIIVSDSVWGNTKKQFSYEKLKPIKVKGKKNKVGVYKIKF